LNKDNAKLLQRWLDAKQVEANKMNTANEFYENMRSRNQAVLNWRDGSGGVVGDPGGANNNTENESQVSVSGNGDANEENGSTRAKNGTPSPAAKRVDLTPNG
jgi:autophagy-related protein 16